VRRLRLVATCLVLAYCWLASPAPGRDDGHVQAPQQTDSRGLDKSQLHDITDIEMLPPQPPPAKWPIWLALGIAILASWKLANRANRKAPQSPAMWALQELRRAEMLDLGEPNSVERFHTLISEVLRRYLELRFDLQATRQTSTEFLETIHRCPLLRPDQQLALRDLLQRCDLAKFARASYSSDECRESARIVRGFVQETSNGPATPVQRR